MRIPGAGTDMFIDRSAERDCMIQAASVGVGPRVAYQIDPEGVLVIDYVDGEVLHPLSIAGHPDRIMQAVETVRAFHSRAVFKNEINVFHMLRSYAEIAGRIGASLPEKLVSLLGAMDEIEEAMTREPVTHVACHNDLLSENFIVDDKGKMWVIDWEYGGMTDPYFDLGNFVMEHPFSREEESLVVSTYCGGVSDRFFGRMMLYKTVAATWWAVWAMIQRSVSTIDFDYTEWGMERVMRAERGLSDCDSVRWLAEA
jgi:thiamine kinase-like enzyme